MCPSGFVPLVVEQIPGITDKLRSPPQCLLMSDAVPHLGFCKRAHTLCNRNKQDVGVLSGSLFHLFSVTIYHVKYSETNQGLRILPTPNLSLSLTYIHTHLVHFLKQLFNLVLSTEM